MAIAGVEQGEEVNTEPGLFVGPRSDGMPAGGRGEFSKTVRGVFVRVFRGDELVCMETDLFSRDNDRLVTAADQMHFDSTLSLVENGAMAELVQGKVRSEFIVRPQEEVQVEGSSDALGVVVSWRQDLSTFSQIDADEETIPGVTPCSDAAEKGGCLQRFEIADGRTGKENGATFRYGGRDGKAEGLVVVGAHGKDFERKVVSVERGSGAEQMNARNIDRDISHRRIEMLQQKASLAAAAAAEFDEHTT